VWGPSSIATKRGCRYFVTFTDDATRYTVTYLMHTKAEAFGSYKAFEAWALAQQLCAAIKVLRLCYGRSTVVSDLDGWGFVLNVRWRKSARGWTITKSVQRSDG
jgi:hypothetical protein